MGAQCAIIIIITGITYNLLTQALVRPKLNAVAVIDVSFATIFELSAVWLPIN
jgi:hypothetical protein